MKYKCELFTEDYLEILKYINPIQKQAVNDGLTIRFLKKWIHRKLP